MTLVVARKEQSNIIVMSDTRFTPVDPAPREHIGPLSGGLKILVIHPNFCLAFAGDVDTAMSAI